MHECIYYRFSNSKTFKELKIYLDHCSGSGVISSSSTKASTIAGSLFSNGGVIALSSSCTATLVGECTTSMSDSDSSSTVGNSASGKST